MDIKRVNLYLEKYGDYYKASHHAVIKQILCAVPEKYFDEVVDTKLLNPNHVQIASVFGGAFGFDRFLLGDKTMGLVKLFLLGGCGIISLIDIFTIQDKVREKNYETLMKCITSVADVAFATAVPVAINPAYVQQPAPVVAVKAPIVSQTPVAVRVPVAPVAVPAAPKAPVAPKAAPVAAAPAPAKAPVATAPKAAAPVAAPKAEEKPVAPKTPDIAPTPVKK